MLYDADIRDGVCDFLEEQYGKVRFFDELVIGRSRADIVMVTMEGLTGVEIKSDADSYARLSGQIKDYDRFFDRNLVAVGTKHAHHIREHVPDHWGVITVEEVDGEMDLYLLRQPGRSSKVKLENQLGLLWKSELSSIGKANGLRRPAGKNKRQYGRYLAETLPESLLRKSILRELFERDYTIFK